MRTFLVLALLANLIYFGWRFYSGEFMRHGNPLSPAATTNVPPQQGERLVLVSELSSPPAERPRPADDDANAGGPSPEDPVPAGQPDDAGRVPAEAVVAAPEPTIAAATGSCTLISGFETLEPAAALVMRLESAGLDARTLTVQEPVSSTWWVHMPAFASEELARRMLEELQGKGIDSYYMRSGELAGGISLGVFSREESAQTAQEGLARRGYTTSIREVPRMAERYQVLAEATQQALREAPESRVFLADNPSLEVADFVCEAVAEENQFP